MKIPALFCLLISCSSAFAGEYQLECRETGGHRNLQVSGRVVDATTLRDVVVRTEVAGKKLELKAGPPAVLKGEYVATLHDLVVKFPPASEQPVIGRPISGATYLFDVQTRDGTVSWSDEYVALPHGFAEYGKRERQGTSFAATYIESGVDDPTRYSDLNCTAAPVAN